jgi:hypothetical protein
MVRIKVKGTKFKAASNPDQEPDFYKMSPVAFVTPNHSSDEEASHDSLMRQNCVMNPLAMQSLFSSSPAQLPQVLSSSSYFVPMNTGVVLLSSSSYGILAPQVQADSILDQAVDELFMGELGNDDLADSVEDWDPTDTFGAVLENDIQLGYMLEKLLED